MVWDDATPQFQIPPGLSTAGHLGLGTQWSEIGINVELTGIRVVPWPIHRPKAGSPALEVGFPGYCPWFLGHFWFLGFSHFLGVPTPNPIGSCYSDLGYDRFGGKNKRGTWRNPIRFLLGVFVKRSEGPGPLWADLIYSPEYFWDGLGLGFGTL